MYCLLPIPLPIQTLTHPQPPAPLLFLRPQDSLYPRAHTCFNKLDLPMYDSQAELEAHLSFVINAELSGGFTME